MSCIYCFFSKENQMELEKKCFGNPKYEETLKEYKELYLSELQKLDYVRNCNCIDDIENILNYDKEKRKLCSNYLNNFLDDIKNNIQRIEEYFDNIIDVYDTYVKNDIHKAYRKMKNFTKDEVNKVNLERGTSSASYSNLMFRVRPKGNYNNNDIKEYFHIPFDKRFLVGNQRFSLTGRPMIYLASSLQIALKEIGKNIDEVNTSIFLPSFSYLHKYYLFNIKNDIIDTLNNIISWVETGSKIKYNNCGYMDFTLLNPLLNSIFYNILTFPTQYKYKGTFIQEYVLPQLLMDILNYHRINYAGIEYKSTKEYKWKIKDNKKHELEANYCFFIPYSENSNYNEKFLSKFFSYCDTSRIISMNELDSAIRKLEVINRELQNEGYNNSDTGLHLISISRHINNMIRYKGNNYYRRTKEGKIERTLIYGLINNIINHVNYLKNNGLIKKINPNDYINNINILNS